MGRLPIRLLSLLSIPIRPDSVVHQLCFSELSKVNLHDVLNGLNEGTVGYSSGFNFAILIKSKSTRPVTLCGSALQMGGNSLAEILAKFLDRLALPQNHNHMDHLLNG